MIRELTNLMKFINNGTQVFDYSNNIIYSDMKGLLSKKQDDETTAEEFWNLNSNRFPGSFEIFKTFKERLLLEHHQNEFFHVQSRNQVWNRRNQMATH